VLFTNLGSRKGTELAANPRACLVLPWYDVERQVVVVGDVEPVDRAAVEAYFATRPRASRLGTWASAQSSVLSGRDELEAAFARAEQRFEDVDDIPAPQWWGGFRVRPLTVEFWQGRPDRLHDRLRYRRADGAGPAGAAGWVVERLSP
jgi:pyridoxamine 5'-phosphate oxidase